MAKITTTPVVRVPGFSRDELREVDRAARLHRLSRAGYIRLVVLSVAQGRTVLNMTQERIRDASDASRAIGVSRTTPGGVTAAPGASNSLVRSFDPDATP